MRNPGRTYTQEEIKEIAEGVYDTAASMTATVYAQARPIYRSFGSLSQEEKEMAHRGMEDRIKREGLLGYIERKRSVWGNRATDAVVSRLKSRGFIEGVAPAPPVEESRPAHIAPATWEMMQRIKKERGW